MKINRRSEAIYRNVITVTSYHIEEVKANDIDSKQDTYLVSIEALHKFSVG